MSNRVCSSLCAGVLAALTALSAGAVDHGPAQFERAAYREYVDSRYDHGRAYPARGQYVRALPRERVVVFDRGHRPFYLFNGAWYAPRRTGFVVVGAQIGAFVSVLPPFYTTVWSAVFRTTTRTAPRVALRGSSTTSYVCSRSRQR